MTTILSPPDQRVTLSQVSWETYRRLISEHGDASSPRWTYDRGFLEIMSPSAEHERYNLRIADLIGDFGDEIDIEVEGLGATTFSREDLERGFETDSCFYVQNVDKVRNKERLDLTIEPPPDLVVEIEITNPSINKLLALRKFGVDPFPTMEEFRRQLDEAVKAGSSQMLALGDAMVVARRLQDFNHARVSGIALGDIALSCLPAEVFVEFGLDIKRRSPFRNTLVSAYNDNSRQYIPTAEAFPEGAYEVDGGWRYIVAGEGEKVAENAVQLLAKLSGS